MRHCHLNHQDFTLAAIDDIINNGQRVASNRKERSDSLSLVNDDQKLLRRARQDARDALFRSP